MNDLVRHARRRCVEFLNAVGQLVPAYPERMSREGTTVHGYTKNVLFPKWEKVVQLDQKKDDSEKPDDSKKVFELAALSYRPRQFWPTLVEYLKCWNIFVPWVERVFADTFLSWHQGKNLDGFSTYLEGNLNRGVNLMPWIEIPDLRAGVEIEDWLELIRCQARRAQDVVVYGDLPLRRKRKLESSEDLKILASFQVGGESQTTLGSRYGVSQPRICKLLRRTADELCLTLSRPRGIT